MTWTREKIRAELFAVLGQHAQPGAEVADQSHLVGDLGIDSLGVMESLADIEDKFKLQIPDDALSHVETVADVAGYLEKRLAGEGRLEG